MSNVELRNSFYLKKRQSAVPLGLLNHEAYRQSLRLVGVVAPTPRRATSTIRQSSFDIRWPKSGEFVDSFFNICSFI